MVFKKIGLAINMSGNSIGKLFTVTSFGESHGPAIGCIVDGCGVSEDGLLIVEVGNSGEALEQAFPAVPFMWFEFAEGDSGVFMLTQAQLAEHREMFA